MTLFDTPPAPNAEPHLDHVVTFTAHGHPKPQGSKRAFINKHTGRAGLAESGERAHKDWRGTVTSAALDAMGPHPMVQGPLVVTMVFALQRPKSHPKRRRTWPVARPDVDKLARAVLDSCNQVVWRDDTQVVDLRARKVWAEIDIPHGAGVDVTVHLITEPGVAG